MLKEAQIGSIDPEFDYKTIVLSKKQIDRAYEVGYLRDLENRGSYDKGGYDKNDPTKGHFNADNDALGAAFEIGCTEMLGLDSDDESIIKLFHKKPYPPDTPDILGIYECRRLNNCKGKPGKGVTWYNKDITNTAYVLTGVVEHECVNRQVRITGRVTIYGWNYPLIDEKHTQNYIYKNGVQHGGVIKPFYMRNLTELPMLSGAGWVV